MVRSARHGLIGVALGLGTGIAAALLLAPKRRRPGSGLTAASAADAMLDSARGLFDCARSFWRTMRDAESARGLLPDERLTLRVRSDLERRAIWGPWLNLTTIDGAVYVRGRETDPTRAETVLRAVREVPGVVEVVDELRRE